MILHMMAHEYKDRGVKVCFVKLNEGLVKKFLMGGIISDSEGVFPSLMDALQYVNTVQTVPSGEVRPLFSQFYFI